MGKVDNALSAAFLTNSLTFGWKTSTASPLYPPLELEEQVLVLNITDFQPHHRTTGSYGLPSDASP